MALPWVRLEANWFNNPKFLMLAADDKWRAITVNWAGLAWSGGQGQDGFIPYYALPTIFGNKQAAETLSHPTVRLWVPCEGGWQINDYDEYQPSSEEHALRSKKARESALIRWHGKDDRPP